MKTLIELFDTCQIENLIAGLRLNPEKIIFVGFDKVMRPTMFENLKTFFNKKRPGVIIESKKISRYDYDKIYCALEQIVTENEDCCFDLTGGKELVLTAMGALSVVRNIPMVQFNIRSGNLMKIQNSDDIESVNPSEMSISECISVNGGGVVKNTVTDYEWELNEEFKSDVFKIWEICKSDCQAWNTQANMFDLFVKKGNLNLDGVIKVDISTLVYNKKNTAVNEEIFNALSKEGLITDYSYKNHILSFGFKNDQIKHCLLKAGNILELYAYITAHNICDKEPGFYNDMDIGVFVDWDGVVTEYDDPCDTRNEVDLIFMRGLIPVFVSCKNGQVHKEDLYELYSVGEKFGGEYAKKLLLCTYISNDSQKKENIINRAKSMNIDIIEDIDLYDQAKFESILQGRTR